MIYRTRTGKKLSDQSVIGDLSKGTKDVLSGNPSSVGNFFFGLFYYVIGVSAFISRCFLRVRLGERSFGLITVVSIFFVSWLIFNIPELLDATKKDFRFFEDSALGLNNIIAFFMIIPFLFLKAFEPGNKEEFYNLFKGLPLDVQIFIGAISLISLYHLIEVYTRRRDEELINSYYRGDSIFYKLEGIKIFGFEITITRIWMLIEPIAILGLAYSIWKVFEIENIPKILCISGISLFLEEFRVYQENRRIDLDLVDGWLEAQYVNSLQNKFKNVMNSENKKTTIEHSAVLGGKKNRQQNYEGSESPYRAKLY